MQIDDFFAGEEWYWSRAIVIKQIVPHNDNVSNWNEKIVGSVYGARVATTLENVQRPRF